MQAALRPLQYQLAVPSWLVATGCAQAGRGLLRTSCCPYITRDRLRCQGGITRTRTQRFSRRQPFSGISRARFRKTTDLDQPLQLLEQHAYLRLIAAPAPSGRGRPPAPCRRNRENR